MILTKQHKILLASVGAIGVIAGGVLGYGQIAHGELGSVFSTAPAKVNSSAPTNNKQAEGQVEPPADSTPAPQATPAPATAPSKSVGITSPTSSTSAATAPTDTPVAPAAAPTPPPTTVTSRNAHSEQTGSGYNYYCDYTYSDGSSDSQYIGSGSQPGMMGLGSCHRYIGDNK